MGERGISEIFWVDGRGKILNFRSKLDSEYIVTQLFFPTIMSGEMETTKFTENSKSQPGIPKVPQECTKY